jgi:hypothetical protein
MSCVDFLSSYVCPLLLSRFKKMPGHQISSYFASVCIFKKISSLDLDSRFDGWVPIGPWQPYDPI